MDTLLVALCIGRTSVESAQHATLATKYLPDLFLVHIDCCRDLLLLLLNMVECLINVVLLALSRQDMTEQRGDLGARQSVSDALICRIHDTYVVAVLDQCTVPDSNLACKLVELSNMCFKFRRPPIDNLFNCFPP